MMEARLTALKPDAHDSLTLTESYEILAKLFKEIGLSHVAMSRSGLPVSGLSLIGRVESLLKLAALAAPQETTPDLIEQIACLIEVEERDCRQKEHDGKSHHARSILGSSAATCGILAGRVRALASPAETRPQFQDSKVSAEYPNKAERDNPALRILRVLKVLLDR
jgi:hypothetical protein